jgi:ornithine decarboxylase
LASLGTRFDVASQGEIDLCLGLDVPPERLSLGNTIKRESAIADSRTAGIDLFAFDSIAELEKLARSASGSRVFCRILIENKGAEWPLTRKFGCESHMALDLMVAAKSLGLQPVGLSFHVGSQQTDPLQWGVAIAHAAWVYRGCARRGVHLELLNVGGGLPAHYREPIQPLEAYAEPIETASKENSVPLVRTSSSNQDGTSSAMRVCCGQRYCLLHANLCMNGSAGYISMPASTTDWMRR